MSKSRNTFPSDDRWLKKGHAHKEDFNDPVPCPNCGGFGYIDEEDNICPVCLGLGEVEE